MKMVRYELKKVFSRTGGKISVIALILLVVMVSVFAITNVSFVDSDGKSSSGPMAARSLRNLKTEWTGYLTEDVFAEVIRQNAAVEATPEAKSKDWHENNKAYAMKQGYSDIRDIINSALSSFREYNYYNIDVADQTVAGEIYDRRISNLKEWLASDEASYRYSSEQKEFFLSKYQELETPLYYEDADGWTAALEYTQSVIMIMMLILSFPVCSVFTAEYQLKADAVFFSSTEGRRRGTKAKLIAGILMISVIYWAVFLLYTTIVLSVLGVGGWNCPIQTSLMGWKSIYNMTYLEVYSLTAVGGYLGTLFILIAEMLISVITRSAVVSVALPFILLFIPSFVGNIQSLSGFLGLFPDQLLQVGVAVRYFNAYQIGESVIGALPILFSLYPALFILMIPMVYQIFRKSEIC